MNLDSIEKKDLIRWMPSGYDICLCSGYQCPHRFLCLRYLAEPSGRQDYFGSPPISPSGFCDSFMDARPTFLRSILPHVISRLAEDICQQNHTIPELHWLLSEIQLRIENLNEVALSQVIPEHIRLNAYFISQNLYSAEDLHWFIAEQTLLEKILKIRIAELIKK